MTKSIKEKARLTAIRNRISDNTDITPELLKIKISFSVFGKNAKNKQNRVEFSKKIYKTFLNPAWLRSHLADVFKHNIQNRLLNIAKNLEIYEFKINIIFFINTTKQEASLGLLLFDKKKRLIGNLCLNQIDLPLVNCTIKYDLNNPITSEILNNLIAFKNNELNYYRNRMNTKAINIYSKHYRNNILFRKINSTKFLYCYYLKDPKTALFCNNTIKEMELKDTPRLCFFVSNTIDCEISHYCDDIFEPNHTSYIKDIEKYTNMNFLKTLKELNIIKIDISENLTNENLDEFEQLVKLNNY